MKINGVEVRQSKIHGKGLFATKTFTSGERVGKLTTSPAKRNGRYVLWTSDDRPYRVLCDFRYINHSSSPNTCYTDEMEVIALSDISPGEELTHDYGSESEF